MRNSIRALAVAMLMFSQACVDTPELGADDEAYLLAEFNDEGVLTDVVDAAAIGTPVCYVYTDSGPSGRVLSVTQDYEYLKAVSSGSWSWNTWNDVISAVDCRNGGYIWVYEHSYFQGKCRRLSGYIPTLHIASYNTIGDRISSLGFMRKPADCPAW